ncbi:hypothetical protein Tco_1144807 [Tanacetum coccineum]
MVFNSPCLTDKKELIHHEGTALVYVVPTGKDNFIVSAGRPNMVPAGRTIVSPGSIIFGPGSKDLSRVGFNTIDFGSFFCADSIKNLMVKMMKARLGGDDVQEQTDQDNRVVNDFVQPTAFLMMNEDKEEEDSDLASGGDVKVNIEGRDTEMTDATRTIIQTTQVIEDTHVIITPVNPEVKTEF